MHTYFTLKINHRRTRKIDRERERPDGKQRFAINSKASSPINSEREGKRETERERGTRQQQRLCNTNYRIQRQTRVICRWRAGSLLVLTPVSRDVADRSLRPVNGGKKRELTLAKKTRNKEETNEEGRGAWNREQGT